MLDFSGGGVVHLLGKDSVFDGQTFCIASFKNTLTICHTIVHVGGTAGLMLCLFAKFREWRDKRIKGHNLEVASMQHSYIKTRTFFSALEL